LMMFTKQENAAWGCDRMNKVQGYPGAAFTLKCTRDVFKVDVGDSFRLNYTPYGIVDLVCRVVTIKEQSVEDEAITITVVEDVWYSSNETPVSEQDGLAKSPDWSLEPLEHTGIFEAPYTVSGDVVAILPVAARETGTELGYELHMSLDGGTSYSKIATATVFNAYGTLVNEWPTASQTYGRGMYQVGSSEDISPEEVGIQIDFSNTFDLDNIETIVRSKLFGATNMAILGGEIISFQTMTPVAGHDLRYELTGIYRGRLDTLPVQHAKGESFWFVGV
ncbi:unnamed protein product, partial [marine sediment metagenome]